MISSHPVLCHSFDSVVIFLFSPCATSVLFGRNSQLTVCFQQTSAKTNLTWVTTLFFQANLVISVKFLCTLCSFLILRILYHRLLKACNFLMHNRFITSYEIINLIYFLQLHLALYSISKLIPFLISFLSHFFSAPLGTTSDRFHCNQLVIIISRKVGHANNEQWERIRKVPVSHTN